MTVNHDVIGSRPVGGVSCAVEATVARKAHNLEVGGSNPSCAIVVKAKTLKLGVQFGYERKRCVNLEIARVVS